MDYDDCFYSYNQIVYVRCCYRIILLVIIRIQEWSVVLIVGGTVEYSQNKIDEDRWS